MRVFVAGALMLGALLCGSSAVAETLRFHAHLTGAAGRAAGEAEFTLDTDSKMLAGRVTYDGLSGPVTGGRFAAPPEPGSAPGSLALGPPFASPLADSRRLSDIEIGDLRAGLWSIILVTARHPDGEIRGDLEQAP